MSGLALVWNRDGAPVERACLDGVLSALAHRGPDGVDACVRPDLALGHRHFWTTPEEAGERQPLAGSTGDVLLVFDGRLDNRAELLAALDLESHRDPPYSDAAIVLSAYARWGERCFERFLGPFAVALYDHERRRVLCVRDPLGDRTLFYYLDPRVLVVASEESAVLAHPDVPATLNETTLAHFFATQWPADGATFFEHVRELLPAHTLTVEPGAERLARYWQFEPDRRLRYRDDAEYAEHFRALLAESVSCRMRAVTPPAVQMSGGLDSTAIAALAARELAAAGTGARLRTISYVFDELDSCDERPYIRAMIEQYQIDSIQVSGDGDWPLRDWQSWPWNPNQPDGNAYRRLNERVYATAEAAGIRVLLSGIFADHLYYCGAEEWLADLLAEGRLAEAAGALGRHIRNQGLSSVAASATVRRVGSRLYHRLPGAQRLRRPYRATWPAWLTPYALGRLPETPGWSLPAVDARRWRSRYGILEAQLSRGAASESFYASRFGVELRYPYRDRRLLEFILAVPGHQLFNCGNYKHVLRNAMIGLLPEPVRTRIWPTSFIDLYLRGLGEREPYTARALLDRPDAIWRDYVRPDQVFRTLASYAGANARESDCAEGQVPWLCIGASLWRLGVERSSITTRLSSEGSAVKYWTQSLLHNS